LVGRENLGASVPERDEQALVNALEALLFDDDAHAAAKSNVMRVREQFTWERVLKPLVDFCNAPVRAADRASTIVESSSSRNKLVARVGGQKSSNHRGLRRDIDRVMYYLKNGGVAAVLERIDARRTRKQKSKLNA
jgi:hypothetical protein